MYKFGSIVLIPFPFTDLTSTKLRPALIISKTSIKSEDVILAFITSKTKQKPAPHEYRITTRDIFFNQTGLKVESIIRFDKLATLNKKLILGELGLLPPIVLKKARSHILSAFGF